MPFPCGAWAAPEPSVRLLQGRLPRPVSPPGSRLPALPQAELCGSSGPSPLGAYPSISRSFSCSSNQSGVDITTPWKVKRNKLFPINVTYNEYRRIAWFFFYVVISLKGCKHRHTDLDPNRP